MINLNSLGWNEFFNKSFKNFDYITYKCGRISAENKTNYLVLTQFGEIIGEVSGKYLFESERQSDLPKVGDWVVITLFNNNELAVIHQILPRRTKISRKSADRKTDEQIIAANVDLAFIVQSLDDNFNINRLERYLSVVYQGGVKPVVVLNKTDLCNNVEEKVKLVTERTGIDKLFSVSAIKRDRLDEIIKLIEPGSTVVFIGSSGVGKSTLINALVGYDRFATNEVREQDSRGKHTTTRREMVLLPSGGILIDTPGMRELGLWNANYGLSQTFSEFSEFAEQCKYSDCTHVHEAGCAILQALSKGEISKQRYENYTKLLKEIKYLESKQNIFVQIEEKRKWKIIHKELKNFNKKNNQ
ncbi:MAG: ribosome small subunit-dependent GTPase A [Bacteroidota bacterium]